MNYKYSKFIFAFIAILGYILNINNYKLASYVVWGISNSLWALYSFKKSEYEMSIMFTIYNAFCIYGVINEI